MTEPEEKKTNYRLSKVAQEFTISASTIVDFLAKQKIVLVNNPNTKMDQTVYDLIAKEYGKGVITAKKSVIHKETLTLKPDKKDLSEEFELDSLSIPVTTPKKQVKKETEEDLVKVESETISTQKEGSGPTVLGRIDLSVFKKKKPKAQKEEQVSSPKAQQFVKEVDVSEIVAELVEKKKQDSVQSNESSQTSSTGFDQQKTASIDQTIRANIPKSNVVLLGKIDLPLENKKAAKKKIVTNTTQKVDVHQKNNNYSKPQSKTTPPPTAQGTSNRSQSPTSTSPAVETNYHQRTNYRPQNNNFKASRDRKKVRKENFSAQRDLEKNKQKLADQILKVTEFVTVADLSSMMNVTVNQLIASLMPLGVFASINQRLSADIISLIAEEYGFKVDFVSAELNQTVEEEEDTPDTLQARPPIVTVMGHVDHGKTSLLDYIRKANVTSGEAGGITQHMGAYSVKTTSGQIITFLDTPGHEAFTAMRARGAELTDIVIIVIAADDSVMPQTKEAINHAQAAGVPIIFAINKIDKYGVNPNKIREDLAGMNILVEDWGGKYQVQEVSAKTGLNIDLLLEKVLLEAEMLDLKANPNKRATGTIVESQLDKGRGFVSTLLVQSGTMSLGDVVLSGAYYGKIKAMFNEKGQKVNSAGPSMPVSVLGINGAPSAGERFNVMAEEKEAKEIANKRDQLYREQDLRTKKHISLDEIGRRIAVGNFQELNIIIKGDVDGSIEALADALEKLTTEEIQVRIIHKAVGQITESDVLLATASNAIIVGFQVRPSAAAKKLAETEKIDIRLYSIIYQTIDEIKMAMEGMLAPEMKEEIIANIEIRQVFKISKVGTVAGCYVLDGKVSRDAKIRVLREGIVIYTGIIDQLKRFKDDVKEVAHGYECGLSLENYNDLEVGDILEAFKEVMHKRKLSS